MLSYCIGCEWPVRARQPGPRQVAAARVRGVLLRHRPVPALHPHQDTAVPPVRTGRAP